MQHYNGPERRNQSVDLDELIQKAVTKTVQEIQATCLNPDEQRWVRLAIEKEGRRAVLARAIIEKSLAGLLWAAIVGAGLAFWREFLRALGISS